MSATVVATRPGLRLRGAAWLSWRQSRVGLLVVAALVVATIAVLLYDRHQLDVAQARIIALHCDQRGGSDCADAENAGYVIQNLWHDLALGLVALPGLLGAALAAQPLASDFERGRHLVLWSQSISPRRWFTQRLAVPGVVLFVLSSALSLTVRWVAYGSNSQLQLAGWSQTFGTQDLAPVYPVLTLAAFALGALVGLMLHRVIAALGVTLLLYGVLVLAIELVRPYLLPLHFLVVRTPAEYPHGAWVHSTGVELNGKAIQFDQCPDSGCGDAPLWIRYHPASELTPIAWIETGILAVLAAALVALAYRRLAALTR